MAHELVAPWAELAPDRGPMTVDEMLALPDDGWMYELVAGRLVRMPGSGFEASIFSLRLASALLTFVEDRDVGRVTGADGTYNLTQTDDVSETALVPDVAFVRADRLPPRSAAAYAKALRLAPDLVAEVVSPTQYRPEMEAKARLYLAAGVRLLWMVWPKFQEVDVWRPGPDQPITTLHNGDSLDGIEVLPGFSYPLVRLFA